jgi:hypothetical protein
MAIVPLRVGEFVEVLAGVLHGRARAMMVGGAWVG